MFEQSINTSVIVACLNDFCRKIKKKTIVVMDNLLRGNPAIGHPSYIEESYFFLIQYLKNLIYQFKLLYQIIYVVCKG